MTTILHPEITTDEFYKTVEEIHYLVTQYGIDQLKPEKENKLEAIKFHQLVHDGWKKAQDIVIRELLLIQDEILVIKRKIKNHNKNRRRTQVKELKKSIEILTQRTNILQKSIDAIIWQIFQFEDHILKRFFLNNTVNNINRKSLMQALEYVDIKNKDNNAIAICCDLSTFMHVGDVILLDGNSDTPLQLVELKEGKTNQKLHEVLNSYFKTKCERNLYYNTRNLSELEIKQLARMSRQIWRSSQITLAQKTGKSTCISTGSKVNIPEERHDVDLYIDKIYEMYEEIENGKTWSIRDVDNCLYLGLYSDHRMSIGFKAWLDGEKVDSNIFDYHTAFRIPLACPPFAHNLPPDLTLRLSTRKYILLYCLHLPAWMNEANSSGYFDGEFSLESSKTTRKIQTKSKGELLDYHGKLLKYDKGDSAAYIGAGILMKILFRFYSPMSVLKSFKD